jgi:hypothetical protein
VRRATSSWASEARTSNASPRLPPDPPHEASLAGPVAAPAPGKLHAFRALKNRGYRVYFVAQVVSFAGAWMQTVAMGWLVYRLTGSALLLGLVAFLNQVPALVVSPFAGVLIDRLPLRKLVAWTQGPQSSCCAQCAAFFPPSMDDETKIRSADRLNRFCV